LKKNELLRALNDVGTMLNLKTLNIKKKKSIFKNVGTPKGTTFPYDTSSKGTTFPYDPSFFKGEVKGEP